jgi:endonuclease YncB( thermonuclease family)
VRLLGIDTPEKGEPFYEEAKLRLSELLQDAELGVGHGRRRFDRYGRELAFVYADGILLNRVLLAEGLACAYFFMDDLSNLALVDSLCEAQQQARALELGIWSLPEPESCDRYFGKKDGRRFHRPDCSSVTRGDTLNLLRLLSRDEFLDRCYSPCRNCKP